MSAWPAQYLPAGTWPVGPLVVGGGRQPGLSHGKQGRPRKSFIPTSVLVRKKSSISSWVSG